MAVINDAGRKLQHFIVETTEQALVDCLRAIPGPRHLCLEEGTQSTWLYELPHGLPLLITGEILVVHLRSMRLSYLTFTDRSNKVVYRR